VSAALSARAGPIWCAPAAAAQARKDASGRTFFIDHNTRATTWERPPAPKPCPSPPRRGAAPAAERGDAPGGDAEDGEAPARDAAEGESRAAAAPDDGGEGGAEAEAAAQPPKWGLFDLSVDEVGRPVRAGRASPPGAASCSSSSVFVPVHLLDMHPGLLQSVLRTGSQRARLHEARRSV